MNIFGFYDPPMNRWDKILANTICKLAGCIAENIDGYYHCQRCGQSVNQDSEPLGFWNDEDYN